MYATKEIEIGTVLVVRPEALKKYHLPRVVIYLGYAVVADSGQVIYQVKAKGHFSNVIMGYDTLSLLKADYKIRGGKVK